MCWQIKLLNKAILCFMIFVGMPLPRQFLPLRFLIILPTSFSFALLKLKIVLNYLCLILTTLRWFWHRVRHIRHIFVNTWNLKSRNCLQNKCWKFCIIFFLSEIVLPSSFRIVLSLFEYLFEKRGTTVPQKVLLSVTFLVSKLLKYTFLVVLKSFLEKLRCIFLCCSFSICQGFRFQILIS